MRKGKLNSAERLRPGVDNKRWRQLMQFPQHQLNQMSAVPSEGQRTICLYVYIYIFRTTKLQAAKRYNLQKIAKER